MLGKKSTPVIGILTGSLISGNKTGLMDFSTSPITHFEPKPTQSPNKKSFDFGGVGLGIVAALESSGEGRRAFPTNKALISRNPSRSVPIPMISPKRLEMRMETESFEEEYTIVTRHSLNKPYSKVYGHGGRGEDSVFHISPARFGDESAGGGGGFPGDDFLSSCHLCHKRLQGEDIYMYRGEKAFCSTECRYREIVMDERREKCSSEASRGVDVSSSPYANGQMFTAGILAV